MKTIILKGCQGSGKTTTILLVYYFLLKDGAKIVVPRTKITGRDFYCVLEYKGKTIYIASVGDDKRDIWYHIDTALSGKVTYNKDDKEFTSNVVCDVCIGASHFAGTDFLADYNPIIIDKTGYRDDLCDIADAQTIINRI